MINKFLLRIIMSKKKLPYTQKYRVEWKSDINLKDWIQPIPTDVNSVYCKFCKCILKAHYNLLIEHTKTKKHTNAAEPFSSARQIKIPFKTAPKSVKETATAEAGLTLFIICHCALRNIDHLHQLTKKIFNTAKGVEQIHLGRTKCTGIIKNIIAPHFMSDLRKDIGDSPYSLLIDESTDISVSKQLGISIIYFSKMKGRDISTFLTLHKLEKGDAASIAKAVKEVIQEFGLDLRNMRGLGTDNATVMTGINTGVYQRLKADIPHLILIRCVNHSIQLAVSEAVKEALPKNLEFLICGTYTWFARSAERQGNFQVLYNTLNDGENPLKILKVADTRWLSISQAVTRILKQWLELRLHFELWKGKDKCFTAELLFNMYSDVRNELYLLFLQPILEEAQKVNKVFQTNENDPVKLLKSLTLLIQGLAKRIVIIGFKGNFLTVNVKNHLHPNPYLGFTFEEKIRQARSSKLLNVDDEMTIRSRCINFVATLVSNLQLRLPDNVEVLQSVSLLAPENCLRIAKPSVIPLAQLMQEPPEIITNIDFQWSKISFVEWENTKKTVPFWVEVLQYKDAAGENPFVDLANFAIKCLVLPWSNGEIERAFSQMKIVKSPHRNRLDDSTLIAILTIRAGLRRLNLCCSTYQFPASVLDQIGTFATYTPHTLTAENAAPLASANKIIFDDVQKLQPFEENDPFEDENNPIFMGFF